MNIIETHNIRKNFGTKIALDGVSIHIPQNEICGFLGPNGAGKTTLMRILTRILQPDDGSILFNNRIFCDKDIVYIGYLPEERGLYSSMKIAEQLIFLARLKGISLSEAKRRTFLWLEKFGLDNRARHTVGSLSKGLQQKIQFIGAIICSPQLLILDEPFSGLDPISTTFMREEIVTLQKQGTTVLLSTHDLNEASALCSNIIFINDARVRWQGELSDIRKQYSSSHYRFTTERICFLSSKHRDRNTSLKRTTRKPFPNFSPFYPGNIHCPVLKKKRQASKKYSQKSLWNGWKTEGLSMNKIFLITQREYRFHLSQRSFWLMTVLLPLLFAGGYFFFKTSDSGNSNKEIWIIDRTALYAEAFTNCDPDIKYISLPQDTIPTGISPLATLFIGEDLLKCDGQNVIFYSSHEEGAYIKHQLTILLTDYLHRQKLAQLPEEIRRQVDIDIEISDMSPDETMYPKADNEKFNTHLIFNTLIYLFIFMYSAQVLQSTVQEKNNRMIEILLTSVKAQELIYGKIIAIGLCGITQFCIWGLSLILIYSVGRETIAFDISSHINIYYNLYSS